MVKDIVGKRYGKLTVLRRVENDKYGNAVWECLCDCGTICDAAGYSLRLGHKRSCGCFQREVAAGMKQTHNKSKHPLYKRWYQMISRCENHKSPSYIHYGAKGIKVCEEWKSFENFYIWAIGNGYKRELTIERKNVYGDYCPQNCTFATREQQNRNTTRTIRFVFRGQLKTISEIAKELNMPKWKMLKDYHTIGQSEFMDKYHLDGGIPADKTICKIYKIKGARQ